MGCLLVLALGVYCYRHHIHRNSHQYISNLPEQPGIRMSNFDGKPDEDEISEKPGPSGKSVISLCVLIFRASVVSACRYDTEVLSVESASNWKSGWHVR